MNCDRCDAYIDNEICTLFEDGKATHMGHRPAIHIVVDGVCYDEGITEEPTCDECSGYVCDYIGDVHAEV